MVKFLIKNKADLTVRTNDDISLLKLAIWYKSSKIAAELMKKENQIIPLSANHHLLNILIDLRKTEALYIDWVDHTCHGTDTKQPSTKYLLNIIIQKPIERLKHLIKLGLDVNQCDKGQSLLKVLIESPQVSARYRKLELFIQNGADLTVRDGHSLSVLEKTRQFINQPKGREYEINDQKYSMQLLRKHTRRNSL